MGTKSEAAKRSWKQWKPEQARRELEAWRSSGLTLTKYADRRGVTTTRLRYWHARLGEPASSEMRLVPATVMPMPAPMAASWGAVTVRLPGDVTLEVSDVSVVPSDWIAAVAWKLSRAV